MEYRNAAYIRDGRIDCEINHERLGWIPFTAASTGDTKELFDQIVADGAAAAYVAPTPPPVSTDQVKAEAYRRIVLVCPEWKQRNLTAQAAILADTGRDNWTAQDLADWNAGKLIWDAIDAIRAASDTLEATTPIPQDYTDDTHWP